MDAGTWNKFWNQVDMIAFFRYIQFHVNCLEWLIKLKLHPVNYRAQKESISLG